MEGSHHREQQKFQKVVFESKHFLLSVTFSSVSSVLLASVFFAHHYLISLDFVLQRSTPRSPPYAIEASACNEGFQRKP